MDENYYRRRFLITYLNKDVPEDMMQRYIDQEYSGFEDLWEFVNANIKNEHTWITGVGLIDAMDAIIESVKEEGYLNWTK